MIVIPIYDMVLLPGVNFYFNKESCEKWKLESLKDGEDVLFLLLKNQKDIRESSREDYYPVGFLTQYVGTDSEGMVQMKVKERVQVCDIENENGLITASASDYPETQDLPESDRQARFETLRAEYLQFIQGFQWGIWVRNAVTHWQSMEELVCATSVYLPLSWEEKYAIMEEDSIASRYNQIEEAVRKFFANARIAEEAQNALKEEQDSIYRESAIRKQISYLQGQLQQMNPEEKSEAEKYEQKIAESGMNDTARKEAEKVLRRLKQEGPNGHEYGLLCDYLDFVTGLSWKKETMGPIDLKKVRKVLDEDHYGLKKVKERVVQQMAVMALSGRQSGSILLFAGAPGTGKTSIGQSIARALNRKYVRISLGGIRDEAEIRGHRRTYVGAMPGRIMEGIRRSGVSNPVVVLDEVDKLAKDLGGDPASALLEVLDPEQNSTFTDHYMNVPYDLSDVLFICTANATDTIPEPLLNRMELISFTGYTALEKQQIARKHLLPKAMEQAGIKPGKLKVTEKAVCRMVEEYTMESGVRSLRRQMDALCRQAAVRLVSGEAETINVSARRLPDFLDQPVNHHDRRLEKGIPGVATGLAWTSGGGEILYMESRLVKGSGDLIVTGQLGDVMKESVQIAVSLAKALYPKEAEKLKDHDLHFHVPAGAVPKDGPSAGITIVTALASLLTETAADPQLAMTGEISLRGSVMPIGGLPEKLMAAVRAGIRKVLIPADNLEDLKEVPEEVKKSLEIVPVKEIREVLQIALDTKSTCKKL